MKVLEETASSWMIGSRGDMVLGDGVIASIPGLRLSANIEIDRRDGSLDILYALSR